ncbi:SAM-dependent methyltransferase [Agromyces atrinae]|uniref:class I SAM-dependent methyltransferase n=1 Tax=Agromyces atrinae TaxID=592376 RepID=UPI001F57ABD1|nr:SAM-dependent methyltransferase [Agromyces atrinae]MCI2957859.1 SAM-dependent methyltransferase [Agromyces atrinae]
MDRPELVELLSPEGLRLLDSLPPWTPSLDAVKAVSDLRRLGHSPALVSAVLTQSRLRAKARAKFGEFADRMLFTEAGLEQATRLSVAAIHAGRFDAAGVRHVADLGCGIGGDALAFAAVDLDVTAADIDDTTAVIASFNLAPWSGARALNAAAEDVDLAGIDGVWLDPARRTTTGGRTTRLANAADYSPSLDFGFALASDRAVGMKLGPGTDRDVIPDEAEAQWVSVDGDVVELALWFGPLARPGVKRAALVIARGAAHELTNDADSADEPVGDLGDYLYEPDGAVIRSRLIGDLARRLDARMLSDGIAYLTADAGAETPFATRFRILEHLPTDEKKLRVALRERGIGVLEIKKRGIDVDPAQLRKRLQLRGESSATIVMTRQAGRHVTLLVERV